MDKILAALRSNFRVVGIAAGAVALSAAAAIAPEYAEAANGLRRVSTAANGLK